MKPESSYGWSPWCVCSESSVNALYLLRVRIRMLLLLYRKRVSTQVWAKMISIWYSWGEKRESQYTDPTRLFSELHGLEKVFDLRKSVRMCPHQRKRWSSASTHRECIVRFWYRNEITANYLLQHLFLTSEWTSVLIVNCFTVRTLHQGVPI